VTHLLWLIFCDTFFVTHLLWHIFCDTSFVTHLLWHIFCDTSFVSHLLWHIFCDTSFVTHLFLSRYLAVPTMKVAQQAIWLSGVSITVILSIVSYAGKGSSINDVTCFFNFPFLSSSRFFKGIYISWCHKILKCVTSLQGWSSLGNLNRIGYENSEYICCFKQTKYFCKDIVQKNIGHRGQLLLDKIVNKTRPSIGG